MKSFPIVWQRLVSRDGRTCDRCGATGSEVERAVAVLREVLRPLGLVPTLETREIDQLAFAGDPSESNRIWIADRPMEDWLEGTVGSSPCCSVCGDSPCRTVEIRGRAFETIPEDLIVRAALVAAATVLDNPG